MTDVFQIMKKIRNFFKPKEIRERRPSPPILMKDHLLQCLVECSEKAARIAQIFREEDDLFKLLVQEKSQIEINKCFFQDFKTLADVLVQETIKKDLGEQFPDLKNISGEEQNTFENALGESIKVEINTSPEDTTKLLEKVLGGNTAVAHSLSTAVHSKITCEQQHRSCLALNQDSVGVWIDPIDCTAEYIRAKVDSTEDHSIQQFGLNCVCVLIGAYDLSTGNPMIGVINQPFYSKDVATGKWCSRCYWGIHYPPEIWDNIGILSPNLENIPKQEEPIIVLSNTECQQMKDILNTAYKCIHVSGAGHKALVVACQKADLYILSHSSTFLWDVCGPHAILAAMGGGVIKLSDLMTKEDFNKDELGAMQINYKILGSGVEACRNVGGIVAYRKPEDVVKVRKLLLENGYVFTMNES